MNDSRSLSTASWRPTAIASVTVFIALLALFWPTVWSMVDIWYNRETYTHGFLILPIALWLIWQKRHHVAVLTPGVTPAFLLFVVGALVVWSLGRLVGALVVEQFALVAVLVSAVASLVGWRVSRFLAFPLLFLFFAVPMGEDLVPPMMEFTATFTVEALRLTGIPVYRDGLWFSLPSGNWSVVEACSGVRYLIASVTLGMMYAYITYHTLWKRLLFVAMSVIVPVVANGIRAYMIVMIGHLSNMEYATGVDHLIYGWFFFGVVMFILFWIGSFWQEHDTPPDTSAASVLQDRRGHAGGLLLMTGVILLAGVLAVWATRQAEAMQVAVVAPLAAPEAAGDWQREPAPVFLAPATLPTDHKVQAVYRLADGTTAELFVALFPQQTQGQEAITSGNQLAAEKGTRVAGLGLRTVSTADGDLPVFVSRVTRFASGREREYLAWQWYRVAGKNLTNRYLGKAWEAFARIYPGRADGAWIAVATPMDGQDPAAAEKVLGAFVRAVAPAIGHRIDVALGLAP